MLSVVVGVAVGVMGGFGCLLLLFKKHRKKRTIAAIALHRAESRFAINSNPNIEMQENPFINRFPVDSTTVS